jgi:hypothetical protein
MRTEAISRSLLPGSSRTGDRRAESSVWCPENRIAYSSARSGAEAVLGGQVTAVRLGQAPAP